MDKRMTDAKPALDESWDGILDTDETIIWQGRPDGSFAVTPGMISSGVFGLFFTGFAVFWMLMAAQAGGFFWTFGLIHFSVGLALLGGTVLGPSFMRRRTWYTLTNQRAFIAKTRPLVGRSLKSYPITPDTVIELQDGAPSSIMFATQRKRRGKTYRMVPVGFERIDDARHVLQLLRNIQKDQA